MPHNQRKAERVPVVLEASWDGCMSPGRVTDLSMGGCYLDTIGQAKPGDSVTVNIHLPDGKILALSGIASYFQIHTGFGIQFTDLSEEQQALLAELLASQGPSD
jgi:PilZ domain